MSEWVMLGEKAHCRFGDKGDTGLFVVVPYVADDYAPLMDALTVEQLSQHFGDLPLAQIRITPCPQLGAVVIAMRNSLGGGVTRSLGVDIHGKTRSGYLLGMKIAWPMHE
jgi:hypothetical protein